MSDLNNPAGRLYGLLVRFNSSVQGNVTAVWGEILGTQDPVDLAGLLAEVASLVPAAKAAATRSGSRSAQNTVARYAEPWLKAVTPFDKPMTATAPQQVRPSDAALEALDSVSEILSQRVPDGDVPDGAHVEQLRQQVEGLIAEAETAEDVPEEVKAPLLERLRQIHRALNNLWLGGPDAVRSAVEQLVGAMSVAEAESPNLGGSAFKRMKKNVVPVIAAIWIVFTAAPGARTDVSAWEGILEGHLTNSPAQIAPAPETRQLPPGDEAP